MKFFILILIFAAFVQSSFVPINLVLILLISNSLVKTDRANLIAAFITGILLGMLSSDNLGYWALALLVVVKLIELIKKLPLSVNFLTALPISFVVILGVEYTGQVLFGQAISIAKLAIETILVLPCYLILNLIEIGSLTPDLRLKS